MIVVFSKNRSMISKIKTGQELGFHDYTESEIVELGMKPIKDHNMDYLVYEKNKKAYFFEKISNELYRLFIITSRQSFYLS